MKQVLIILTFATMLVGASGCTCIVEMEPKEGPPGTPVWIKTTGLWGDPGEYQLKWDGDVICEHFSGSFKVPDVCNIGKHKVTLVDKIDSSEICLIFPLARLRTSSKPFIVTEP